MPSFERHKDSGGGLVIAMALLIAFSSESACVAYAQGVTPPEAPNGARGTRIAAEASLPPPSSSARLRPATLDSLALSDSLVAVSRGAIAMAPAVRDSAILRLERALDIRKNVLGSRHPQVAETMTDLARALAFRGDRGRSRELLKAAFDTQKERMFAMGRRNPSLTSGTDPGDARGALVPDGLQLILRDQIQEFVRQDVRAPALQSTSAALAQQDLLDGDMIGAFENALSSETQRLRQMTRILRWLTPEAALNLWERQPTAMNELLTVTVEDPSVAKHAWNIVIRWRAMVLDELAFRHRLLLESQDPSVTALQDSLASVVRELASSLYDPDRRDPDAAEDRTARLETRRQVLDERLALRSGFFRRVRKDRDNAAGFSRVAAALPDSSALVAFVAYRSQTARTTGTQVVPENVPSYLAFTLRSGESTPRVIPLGPVAVIDSLIASWRERVTSVSLNEPARAEAAYREAAGRLKEKLWDPIAAAMGPVARVFVVPDGRINLVSFATLPASGDRYLIERGPAFHYLSAERDLVAGGGPRTGSGVFVMGNASFDAVARGGVHLDTTPSGRYRGGFEKCIQRMSHDFPELPGTRFEIRRVRQVWMHELKDEGLVRMLEGQEASETNFKREAPSHEVVHVATHGFFLDGVCGRGPEAGRESSADPANLVEETRNPLTLCGLVLAGANERRRAKQGADDGILTADEITGLDLREVEWVVLSACETGLGRIREGEGVFGLRRAFEIAGAHTLISSLWKIDDSSAPDWMAALYESRIAGKDVPGAVRAASLTIIEQRRKAGLTTHPATWGAFVASGDWR